MLVIILLRLSLLKDNIKEGHINGSYGFVNGFKLLVIVRVVGVLQYVSPTFLLHGLRLNNLCSYELHTTNAGLDACKDSRLFKFMLESCGGDLWLKTLHECYVVHS